MPDEELSDIDKQRMREDHALAQSRERQDQLRSIKYPKRGSKELSLTRKAAEAQSALLTVYDVAAERPALADATQELFAEYVARLNELCKAKKAPPKVA